MIIICGEPSSGTFKIYFDEKTLMYFTSKQA